MELEKIIELLGTPDKLRAAIMAEKPKIDVDLVKSFDIVNHAVLDRGKRKMKKVNRTLNERDEAGNFKVEVLYEEVERIALPFQKRIVNAAVTFLCGIPVELSASAESDKEKALVEAIRQTIDDNKLDYDDKLIAKYLFSEMEVAELWYPDKDEDGNTVFKVQILRSELGTALFPVFNQFNDMVAFGRAYETRSDLGQQVLHFDVYTAEQNYFFETKFGLFVESKPSEKNPNKKIPIIYYSQERVEWADVQTPIERYETLKSNHAETNNYSGSPILKFRGVVTGVGDKHEQGKAVQLDGEGADASYLTYDQAPESIKMEMQGLKADIMDFTSTPDITPSALHGLFGSAPSGYAIKLLFQDAHLKASDHESNFGKCYQRRINYLKSAHCEAKQELKEVRRMRIKPKFEYYLPKNTQEIIDLIIKLKNEGLQSEETSIMMNPLIEDPASEIEKIKQQKEKAAEQAVKIAQPKPNDQQNQDNPLAVA